jgi:hypothetical protein
MFETPATRHARAHLLGIAALAQQSLDLDDPASFWYRQGARDAHAYAVALLATGGPGHATQATADHVIQLLGNGVTDVEVLMEATEPAPALRLLRQHAAAVDAHPDSPLVEL